MRVFAAVRPPAAALDHLEGALRGLGLADHGVLRATARATWHVTLAFYGEVPEGALEELAAGLAGLAARTPAPRLVLRGAGVFSGRTLWVGTGGDVEALVALCHGAREVGREVLGRAEERPRVRPHLTVARQGPVAHDRRRPHGHGPAADLARALAVYEGPAWRAEEVLLVRSRLGQGPHGGPLHEDLAAAPLG